MEKKQRCRVRWTGTKREAFLDHLAATANVCASAEVAGVTPLSVHHLRRKDEDFAEEWRKALALGYDMLETELLCHILAGGGRTRRNADGREIDVQEALRLLGLHRNSPQGKSKGAVPLKRARPEDTDAAIMRKLDAIDRARAREAAERAEKRDGQ